ncbi:MAG: penicillin-binding transpeptidase domain-containing protein [Chlamydiales bacterium]
MKYLLLYFLLIYSPICIFSEEENFLLINDFTNQTMIELGSHINERITPCSTFKIVLSLIGYDNKILKTPNEPMWDFKEGYVDYLKSWKISQTPQSWIKNSCVWYSQIIAEQLGLEKMQSYLALFDYGNQDISGGLKKAWLSSSLKISTKEQITLIQKIIHEKLPISKEAIQITKSLLFIDELDDGWQLFGKTGMGSITDNLQIGWFVGWIQKNNSFFPFAYNIRDIKIDPNRRIPRVKQLLKHSVMEAN